MTELSPLDARIFWGALYTTPSAWAFLFVIGLLRLQIEFLPIVCAAVLMSTANIIGYVKCSNNAKAKAQQSSGGAPSASAFSDSPMRNWIIGQLIGQK